MHYIKKNVRHVRNLCQVKMFHFKPVQWWISLFKFLMGRVASHFKNLLIRFTMISNMIKFYSKYLEYYNSNEKKKEMFKMATLTTGQVFNKSLLNISKVIWQHSLMIRSFKLIGFIG